MPESPAPRPVHEELCQLITQHSRDFIRLHDLQGRSVYASGSVERLYGSSPRTLFEFAHPDDLDRCHEWWSRLIAEKSAARLRWRVRDRDGCFVWMETDASLVEFQSRPHVLTICRDATEQVRTEQALNESRQHLQSVLNNLPVGVFVLNQAGDILLANPASKSIWGEVILSGQERWVRSEGRWHLSGQKIEASEWPSVRALRHGETRVRDLIDIESFHGEKKTIETWAAPLRVHDGNIPEAVLVIADVTARVKAEEGLRQSERVLRDAERLGQTGSWEYVAATGELFASEGHRRNCFGDETARGSQPQVLIEAIHPDDRERALSQWNQLLAGGGSPDFEYRVVWPDGSIHILSLRANVEKDAVGQPVRVCGTSQEITQRKTAEEAIRNSERRLNEAQRIAHLGHWEQDLATGRMTASDETYRIFGLPPQENLKTVSAWMERVHPDDRPIRPAAVERALREGPRYVAEYRLVRPDGEVRVVRSEGEVEKDACGRPNRLFGILHDITEQRQALEARHAAEDRLNHVVASSPAVLFTLQVEAGDFKGIAWMSENVSSLLGYQVEETLGPDWWMNNIHPDDRDSVISQFQSDIATRGHSAAEYRFRHKNGQMRWIRGESRLLRNDRDHSVEVIGSLSDITELKKLEDQFRHAQKMEAVGRLAGGVAHDFNNLLGVVLMSAGLADMVPNTPDSVKEDLQQIRSAADRAANLTRQLLLFSNREVLRLTELDLNDAVTNISKMLRRIIGEHVHLQIHLHTSRLMTYADAGMLDQILVNLAVNARDAMPQGGKLLIETSAKTIEEGSIIENPNAAPGRYVCLSVSDTGTGIEPEVLPRIFEPFFSTKGPGKGTGLGLATVYGIVQQHRGWIHVQSMPGYGTNFQVYLPVIDSSSAEAPRLAAAALRGGSETILLVEDEPLLRRQTRVVLEKFGYQIVEASNGVEALEVWAKHRDQIALLLTDIIMPEGLMGNQLARKLRADAPNLKVLFVSGYSTEFTGHAVELEPGENFLQKPFGHDTLLAKVRFCLDERTC